MVSVEGKGGAETPSGKMQETSVSEPLMKYRKFPLVDVEIGRFSRFRDQLGSHLFPGRAASGIKAA